MPRIIDLDEYRTPGVRVFSGRERGRLIRAKAGLDDLDRQPNPVIVRIPEDVVAVSSGFFLALFGDSIRRFGREGFMAHYRFEGADISSVVEDALEQATTTGVIRPQSPDLMGSGRFRSVIGELSGLEGCGQVNRR